MAFKTLSWGRCKAVVTPEADSGYANTEPITFDKIVKDSTNLTSNEGDKTEAQIEGGSVEAVLQNEDTYTLVFQERIGSTDDVRITNKNGVVNGAFKVEIIPTNKKAKKLTLARASCHVTPTYTANDGIIVTYTFTSLEPDADDETGVAPDQITFTVQS